MKNTFYRPTETNLEEFENIIGKMKYDLHLLENEKNDEWNIYCYIHRYCKLAKPAGNNPDMSFLGLAEANEMPRDARVEFFYLPTYLATAFMIKSVLLYPSLFNELTFLDSELDFNVEIFKQTLKSCMLGCTGRDFDGAGVVKIADTIKLFEEAGANEFVDRYPDFCSEFTELYLKKYESIKSGRKDMRNAWYE